MQLGKIWKRRADSLYGVFQEAMQARGLVAYEVVQDFQVRQIKEMIEHIGESNASDVISFAVHNWEDLRKEPGANLSTDPSFNQMIVKWRYGKWLNMMKLRQQKGGSSLEFVPT